MKLTGRSKTFIRVWKDFLDGFDPELGENGEVRLKPKQKDPSLLSQLRSRWNLVESERVKSYLEACARAPNASEGTKRKWRRALNG